MSEFFRRTWAEVSLDAIDHNFKTIREQLRPETLVCCVIKADAYGHGAEALAKEYEKLGADWFAVSNLEEAMQIRSAGIRLPILILGYTPPCMAAQLCELNIAQTVFSVGYGEALSAEAVKAGVTVRVHIKLDTGMSRIGFMYQNPVRDGDVIDEIETVCKLPSLDPEGIFTHFAVADEGNGGRAYTIMQFDNLMKAIALLGQRGITFKIRHCANSAAIFDYPDMQLDMVRPGVILYGLMPSDMMKNAVELMPAMELKSVVSLVKTVEPQTSVSYGRKYIAKKQVKIATVPIGYADGYPRHLYIKASMLVRGHKAKIIGRVCMDQLMLNVTSIPDVKEGDVVTVFGRDGDACVTLEELAGYNSTINYELVCMISKRVPRIYYKDGKEVGELNYICK
ncbi:alanine racemase [Clostridium sp. KNHs216]|uniref:alanine racemase n=1 Tax=Clostridium sp. KNHs216 TaxID=1550235 RepID=UPI00056FE465|nr:alanine racemase [Clostridium sp. KNHs216]TQI68620.1 alanine racemase [Clostridium sp. KNHs216]